MLLDLLFGIIVGMGVVGSSIARTIHADRGEPLKGAIQSTLNSVFYYLSITFIVKENITAFIGTAIGATIIVIYMAERSRRKKCK